MTRLGRVIVIAGVLALGPITELVTATGSIVTSYAAIKALDN